MATAAVAPQTIQLSEIAIDELEIHGTTAIEARDIEKMRLKALTETILGVVLLGAHLETKEATGTVTVTATAENVETDLQVLARIADDTDTAAIDTVKTGIAIVNDLLKDTEVHDDVPNLHGNHPPHPRKYSDVALSLLREMPSQTS